MISSNNTLKLCTSTFDVPFCSSDVSLGVGLFDDQKLCQSKVGDSNILVLIKKYVLRLDVTVFVASSSSLKVKWRKLLMMGLSFGRNKFFLFSQKQKAEHIALTNKKLTKTELPKRTDITITIVLSPSFLLGQISDFPYKL